MFVMICLTIFDFIIGGIGAFLVARRGYSWGLVDFPNERSSHRIAVPKGGGIGLLVVFAVNAVFWHIPFTLWISACIVSLVSFIGDYKDISFKIRLAVQAGAAAIFSGSIFLGKTFPTIPFGISVVLFLGGILFITATANFYNFMDGINGIAGATGVIAFSSLGIVGLLEHKEIGCVMPAFGIAAACLGFLPLNFPKAKVFMGDVGSVLLGFLFASWVLWISQSLPEFVALMSFLFPFYLDEIGTLLVRIKERDKLMKAHRRHIYQILVNHAGFSHKCVTLAYSVIQIGIAVLSWVAMKEGFLYLIIILALFSVILFFAGSYIRHRWEGEQLKT